MLDPISILKTGIPDIDRQHEQLLTCPGKLKEFAN